MSDLYQLEHKMLPKILFQNEEGEVRLLMKKCNADFGIV